jgi:hypothetical protein
VIGYHARSKELHDMEKKIALIAGLAALFAVGSVHAQTVPTICGDFEVGSRDINTDTGHVFEVWRPKKDDSGTVRDVQITWADAAACATRVGTTPPSGATAIAGHLATITSSDEDLFLEKLRLDARLRKPEVWVGGQNDGAGWRWINNEGPIELPPPATPLTGSYQKWLPGEPNNLNGREIGLAIGLLGNTSGPINGAGNDIGWNDEGNLANIGGFAVEYDYPLTENSVGCTTTGTTTTCGTIAGQKITFPPGTFVDGSSIAFSSYLFRDPRANAQGVCFDRRKLTLFDDPAFDVTVIDPTTGLPVIKSGKLVIPPYLCGSPNFVVVRTEAKNLTITTGFVETTNDPFEMLGGINDPSYECRTPILRPSGDAEFGQYTDASPQTVDTGVWQTLDGSQMWEGRTGTTFPYSSSEFNDGTAAELTAKCTDTLLRTKGKSYFVTGLHLDLGVPPQSVDEYNKLIELTKYKIALVRRSAVEAGSNRVISKSVANSLIGQLDGATAALNQVPSNPVLAEKKILDFLTKVNTSTYVNTPFNYYGDHQSRGDNILYTLRHRVIAFKPAP